MTEYEGPERRHDTPPNGNPILPPDDIVEKTLERAAEKVASVSVPGGPPVLSRMEGMALAGLLILLNCAALVLGIVSYRTVADHKSDFKAMCQVFVNFAPPEQTRQLAQQLAECLK